MTRCSVLSVVSGLTTYNQEPSMYRYKPRVTVAIWLAELAVIAAGAILLWAFLAAFGGR